MINLALSIGGAVAACVDIAWTMTPIGLILFVAWNLVVAVLMILMILNRGQATHQESAL